MKQNNLFKSAFFLSALLAPTIMFGSPLINFPVEAAIMMAALVLYCIFFMMVTPVTLYIIHRETKKLTTNFNFLYLGTLASLALTFFTGIFTTIFMSNFIYGLFLKFSSGPAGDLLDFVVTTALFTIAVIGSALIQLATLRIIYKNLFTTICKPIVKATVVCYVLAIIIVIFLATSLKN